MPKRIPQEEPSAVEFRIKSSCRSVGAKTDQKKILFERSEFIFFPFLRPPNGNPEGAAA
jgi:hypothetical protein